MGRTIEKFVGEMEIGEVQVFENMAVYPLRRAGNGGPRYLTLGEAIEAGVFSVTEISEGGSVPDLQVENRGDVAVLLLDGEELAGAKQNRIINATILVAAKSNLRIPVSCTEQGRWSYVSRQFDESGHQMDRKLRSVNMKAVHDNLSVHKEFRSDQNMIWDCVRSIVDESDVPTSTGAMKDVYDAKGADLDAYMKPFTAGDNQQGMLVFLEGRPVGFDFLSSPVAFKRLFAKLIKSYAMEAMMTAEIKKKRRGRGKAAKAGGSADEGKAPKVPSADDARAFLAASGACDEQPEKSVGFGAYYRYAGKGMVGSALTADEAVVHTAFFSLDEAEAAGPMAGMKSRRNFRL
ncbi:MAG: DUF6569 family protein [Acidobacteriota bacterium]|nr:DUF6569 family protein [Acidobacteriota bacterium]